MGGNGKSVVRGYSWSTRGCVTRTSQWLSNDTDGEDTITAHLEMDAPIEVLRATQAATERKLTYVRLVHSAAWVLFYLRNPGTPGHGLDG